MFSEESVKTRRHSARLRDQTLKVHYEDDEDDSYDEIYYDEDEASSSASDSDSDENLDCNDSDDSD